MFQLYTKTLLILNKQLQMKKADNNFHTHYIIYICTGRFCDLTLPPSFKHPRLHTFLIAKGQNPQILAYTSNGTANHICTKLAALLSRILCLSYKNSAKTPNSLNGVYGCPFHTGHLVTEKIKDYTKLSEAYILNHSLHG